MNKKLKAILPAVVAGMAFIACADEAACAPMPDGAASAQAASAAEQAASGKKSKPRRPRRARRTRKVETSAIPVTGTLDSAE